MKKHLKTYFVILTLAGFFAFARCEASQNDTPAAGVTAGMTAGETDSMKEVMPWADEFRVVECGKPGTKIWAAFDGGKKTGNIIRTEAKGYAGPIIVLFGLSLKKKITGIRVLEIKEDPGTADYICGPQFLWQFQNKGESEVALKADDAKNGRIDAISGATASARSVTQAVRDAISLIK